MTPGDADSPGAHPAPNCLGTPNLWSGRVTPLTRAVQPYGSLLLPAAGRRGDR